MEKNGRLLFSSAKLTNSCSAKSRKTSFVQLESSSTHVSLPVTKERYERITETALRKTNDFQYENHQRFDKHEMDIQLSIILLCNIVVTYITDLREQCLQLFYRRRQTGKKRNVLSKHQKKKPMGRR